MCQREATKAGRETGGEADGDGVEREDSDSGGVLGGEKEGELSGDGRWQEEGKVSGILSQQRIWILLHSLLSLVYCHMSYHH